MAPGRQRVPAQRRTHERGWALVAGDSGQVVARSRSPLVGRRRELQFVVDRLELAEAGRPQSVVVTGPTGIGKTRFGREVRDRAGTRGFQEVVVASLLDDGVPFAPLTHQLVPLLVDSFGADEAYRSEVALLERLAARAGAGAAGATGSGTRASGVDDHHQDVVHHVLTLTRLTVEAAQRHPLLLVVDDLQAADPATASFVDQLLATAARVARHEEVPLLVLVLTGPDRVGPGGDVALAAAEVLPLAGLDRLESLDLLGALGIDTSLPEVEAAIRAADGSPLFLEAVSRTLLNPQPATAWSTVDGVPIPETTVDAVAAEMDELPPDCLALLSELALLAEPVALATACFLLDTDEDALLEAVGPALADGSVEVHDGRIRFTHALRRMAAAARRGPVERAQRHLVLTEKLLAAPPEARPPGAALVAHHLVEAGAHAEEALTFEHAARAAEACLAAGAYLEAERFFDAALAAGSDRSPAELGALHLGAARAAVGALDLTRAGTHAQQAAEHFDEAGDVGRWAEAVLVRFRCVVYRARYRAALPAADDLERVQRNPGLPDELRIEALVTASELAWIQADAAGAASLADEAHQRAHAAGLDRLASASLVSRATAAWMTLDLRGARRLLDEAERLADRAGDDQARAVAAGRTAFTCWLLGEVEAAEEAARRAQARADDAGWQLERAMPLAVQTAIAVARGDRSAAELWADEVILLQRASGDWWTAPFVFGPLAYAAALAGDDRELGAHLRALRDGLGGEAGAGIERVLRLWARAVGGQPRESDVEALAGLHDPDLDSALPPVGVGVDALCAAFVDAIDALDAGSVPAPLRRRLDEAASRGQVMASTLPVVLARVRATAARLDGDLRAAERLGWQAVEIARDGGLEAELARAHLEVARVAHVQKRPGEAGRHVDAFLSLCSARRLHGLVEVAGRLPGVPQQDRVLAAGHGRTDAPGCPLAVVVDLTTHAWLSDRAGHEAGQHVRRQVLTAIGDQVEAFGGRRGMALPLVGWFPSVRLAVEFAFRAVARARRRGTSVGIGIEMAAGPVSPDEAVAVATSLSQLASADEVLISDRARDDHDRSPGLEFRYHSAGRVDGSDEHLTISRARLTRSGQA